jgi:hypothetical protein
MLLASGMTKMYILNHFDWFGDMEELEKWDKIFKKHYDGSEGVEYMGRFGPHNKKYHWTNIWKAKDFVTWLQRTHPEEMKTFKRDYKIYSHSVSEYYEDV